MLSDLIVVILFIFLIFISVHSYILYPVIINIIARLKGKNPEENSYYPEVSILCSAYNEEKVIENRIKNILSLDYDLSKIEMLIGSDCSSDRTNEMLLELQKKHPWLKVHVFSERRGKAAVINDLVKLARHEILVFTDANTEFDRNSLKLLLEDFSAPEIGGVSGRLILLEPEANRSESVEEKKYWEYETLIKRAEGRCGILIGANGGIFAIRKKLFREIPTKKAVTDDFFISLSVLEKDYRFIYRYDAFAFEEVGRSVSLEVKRKIRFASTNFQTMFFFRKLLFNKNILVSYAFWSHKITRWFLPFILIITFLLNILILGNGGFFVAAFAAQLLFYAAALFGYILSLFKIRMTAFSLPYFFVVANMALLLGFFRFMSGKHSIIWQSTPR
ncbi:MAG: glycosyltransferase family 2 protein [Ignavibacteria bacterium]|jgi:cellulose synthase/poly-beta-1,6-N-acetylglucosamine synthase-like glycosyltransferase|nr:glycosyltransferase family 2 protein [Ignavibacteria bacterium]